MISLFFFFFVNLILIFRETGVGFIFEGSEKRKQQKFF